MSTPKPFSTLKNYSVNDSINWKSRKQCNAFMKNGAPAKKCQHFQQRSKKLEEVIQKIEADREINQYCQRWRFTDSFTDTTAPHFLRRNTLKFRCRSLYYREKQLQFIDQLQLQPQKARTTTFVNNCKFYNHLQTMHGYKPDDFELKQVQDVVPQPQAPSRQTQHVRDEPSSFRRPYPPQPSHHHQTQMSHSVRSIPSAVPEPFVTYPESSAASSRAQSRQTSHPNDRPSSSRPPLPPSRHRPDSSVRTNDQFSRHQRALEPPPSRQRQRSPLAEIKPPPSRAQSRQVNVRDNRPQRALEPPPSRSTSRQRQRSPVKEIVLFQSKSPKPRSTKNTSNSSYGNSDQSFLSSIATDPNDENALLRSFYTRYHYPLISNDENKFGSVEELAFSEDVEHSISHPPPSGLQFRTYTKKQYNDMRPYTKDLLLAWKESLQPETLAVEQEVSDYEDDESPLDTWNRLVNESKKRKKVPATRRSLNENQNRNKNFANESFDSVQSAPDNDVIIEKIVPKSRIIATPACKDLRRVGRPKKEVIIENISRVVDVPDTKRPGTYSNNEPSPKKRRQAESSSRRSLQTTSTPQNPIINKRIRQSNQFSTPQLSALPLRTPSTLDLFSRLHTSNEGGTPVRRSPRPLKAICYKV